MLRCYWDGEETPSVETRSATSSAMAGACAATSARCRSPSTRPAASTATGRCRSAARAITIENLSDDEVTLYYQIDYTLTEVPSDARLLPRPVAAQQPAALQGGPHAPRRRARPGTTSAPTWPGASTTTAGGAKARSSSTSTATASSRPSAAPAPRTTSAAPGTSSTAGRVRRVLHAVPGPAAGDQAGRPLRQQQRFGMYRWHIMDPIRFERDLRVTIQALGWRSSSVPSTSRSSALPKSPVQRLCYNRDR